MKNRFTRRRSEELRHKINKESQNSIRNASRRIQEEPSFNHPRNGIQPKSELSSESITGAIKRRFKVGWRVVSLLIVGILSYILLVAWQSPEYRISEIKVKGLQRLTETEVLSKLNVIGEHSFAVVPEIIREVLLASFPEFREVKVSVALPALLEIWVVERQPMIAWQMKNSLIWIDTEGFLIPARGSARETLVIQADSLPAYQIKSVIEDPGTVSVIRDKPFFKGNPSPLAFFALPKQINGSLLTAILQLYAWMPNEKNLLYQKQRGLGWKDTRGWDVFVGQKLEGINDKMVMYETIVRELEKQGINPTLVSVEFLHAPYYRTD